MSSRPLILLGLVVLAPSAAACSDDAPDDTATATTTTEQGGDEVCEALQAVRDFDDESQGLLDESLPPLLAATTPEAGDAAFADFLAQFQPFVEENLAELLATYDTLAAVVPDELASDVVELRDFTASFAGGLADATDRDEVEALFAGLPDQAVSVADATVRIDQFSRDTCDIIIAD